MSDDVMQAAREALTAERFSQNQAAFGDNFFFRRYEVGFANVALHPKKGDFFAQIEGSLADLPALLRYRETATERDVLLQRVEQLVKAVTAAKTLVKDIDDLIATSDGVAGHHKNGDLATWSELTAPGDWLGFLEEARFILDHADDTALSTTPQQTTAPAMVTVEAVEKAVHDVVYDWPHFGPFDEVREELKGLIMARLKQEAPHGS